MAYKILVAPLARKDIIETADYLRAHSDQARATRWKNELLKAIAALDEMPYRCPVAEESPEVGLELREFHYRSHRVIYIVDEPS